MSAETIGGPRRTEAEIAKLKRDWQSDPCWDIEGTEGFEAHRDELTAYADGVRAEWAAHEAAVTAHQTAAHSGTDVERSLAKSCAVRTPVGVAQYGEPYSSPYTIVVCDDGSQWKFVSEWTELPPLPGSTRWFVQNPFKGGAK